MISCGYYRANAGQVCAGGEDKYPALGFSEDPAESHFHAVLIGICLAIPGEHSSLGYEQVNTVENTEAVLEVSGIKESFAAAFHTEHGRPIGRMLGDIEGDRKGTHGHAFTVKQAVNRPSAGTQGPVHIHVQLIHKGYGLNGGIKVNLSRQFIHQAGVIPVMMGQEQGIHLAYAVHVEIVFHFCFANGGQHCAAVQQYGGFAFRNLYDISADVFFASEKFNFHFLPPALCDDMSIK